MAAKRIRDRAELNKSAASRRKTRQRAVATCRAALARIRAKKAARAAAKAKATR